MYIQQNPLFSFNELMSFQPKSRLELIFSKIDLTPALAALPKISAFGPNGYSQQALLLALIAKVILQIPTLSALVTQLQENILLRFVCGFNLIGRTPSIATFSRFYAKITTAEAMDVFFRSLVSKGLTANVIHKKIVAIDSSSIESYEHYQKRLRMAAMLPGVIKRIQKADRMTGTAISCIFQSMPKAVCQWHIR